MMQDLLVGSTGFVGGNLMAAHHFEACCHSTNVADYYGSRPRLCIYAGIPAAMYLANSDPEADLDVMRQARENIRRIAPGKLVLISTIAVYADSRGRSEHDLPSTEGLPAYGLNRLRLEQWVREDYPDTLIIRLPALYGKGLKKNFLFDLLTVTPSMLTVSKYEELAALTPLVKEGYSPATNAFYKLNGTVDARQMRRFFENHSFNALSFTDSRSRYQFYNLGRLWGDMMSALHEGIKMLHMATPPISAAEVYAAVTGNSDWSNTLSKTPFDYDLHTEYASLLSGSPPYLCEREASLADICRYVRALRSGDNI